MLRFLVFLALAAGLAYCGATVKLGKRTFFEHVQAIWKTEEVQELKEGVKETAGPAAERVKRGLEKGYEAATDDGAGSGSGAGSAGSGRAGGEGDGSAGSGARPRAKQPAAERGE